MKMNQKETNKNELSRVKESHKLEEKLNVFRGDGPLFLDNAGVLSYTFICIIMERWDHIKGREGEGSNDNEIVEK